MMARIGVFVTVMIGALAANRTAVCGDDWLDNRLRRWANVMMQNAGSSESQSPDNGM